MYHAHRSHLGPRHVAALLMKLRVAFPRRTFADLPPGVRDDVSVLLQTLAWTLSQFDARNVSNVVFALGYIQQCPPNLYRGLLRRATYDLQQGVAEPQTMALLLYGFGRLQALCDEFPEILATARSELPRFMHVVAGALEK